MPLDNSDSTILCIKRDAHRNNVRYGLFTEPEHPPPRSRPRLSAYSNPVEALQYLGRNSNGKDFLSRNECDGMVL